MRYQIDTIVPQKAQVNKPEDKYGEDKFSLCVQYGRFVLWLLVVAHPGVEQGLSYLV